MVKQNSISTSQNKITNKNGLYPFIPVEVFFPTKNSQFNYVA